MHGSSLRPCWHAFKQRLRLRVEGVGLGQAKGQQRGAVIGSPILEGSGRTSTMKKQIDVHGAKL